MRFKEWLKRHSVVLAVFAAAVLFTQAYYLGDTEDYVGAVINHVNANHSFRWDPLWEFGHLLWRPAGLVALQTLKAIAPTGFGLPDHLLLTRALIGISLFCGLGVALLLHSLALSATRSRVIAACVASGFIVSNAVLNYTQTGNAYVTGLFFVTLSVWIAKRAADSGRLSTVAASTSGAAVATSALFWFPYAFVIPAVAMIPIWRRREPGLRFALKVVIASTLVLVAVYGAVMLNLGIRSPDDAKAWISSAGHGVKPGMTTNAMRMVFGVPRAFIEMGDHGKLIKRFVFQDPYTPTSAVDVVKSAAAPLLLFYTTLAALIWAAATYSEGRRAVYLLAVAGIPVLFFAVFIFEAGSMERYFPVYPFLALVIAYGLDRVGALRNVHRHLAAVLLAVMVVRSGLAMSGTRAVERQRAQESRIGSFRADLGDSGFLAILSNQDELMPFVKTFPFHPLNRPQAVRIYDVFEPGNKRVDRWREDFAARVTRAWQGSGSVWVSKRLTADQPLPSWSWVEGEDARIPWNKGRDFFRQFEYERDSGGEDGFLLLKRGEANRKQLFQLLASG